MTEPSCASCRVQFCTFVLSALNTQLASTTLASETTVSAMTSGRVGQPDVWQTPTARKGLRPGLDRRPEQVATNHSEITPRPTLPVEHLRHHRIVDVQLPSELSM